MPVRPAFNRKKGVYLLKKIIRKTVPFITAAALLAVPAYQTADFFMTDGVSAEYTVEAGDEIIIELGEVTGEAGTKVKLPVYAKNIGTGFSALQFECEMESSFKITRGLKGDFGCTWTISSDGHTVQFLEADGMNVSEGRIGRLEIDIPAGTPDGVYEITGFKFEGSRVAESGKQEKLDSDSFSGVSGKIIIGDGESGNNDPEPSPSPSPEASPSDEASPSPSADPSPSVKPSASAKASPSAKTSPSAKASSGADASPAAKASASQEAKASPSAKSSSSPAQNASSDPDSAKAASPAASNDPAAEKTASPDGNEAAVTGEDGAVQTEVIVVTDAEGNEVTQIVTESKPDKAETKEALKTEPPLSKKVRTGVLIGSVIAILLVLLLVFRRD